MITQIFNKEEACHLGAVNPDPFIEVTEPYTPFPEWVTSLVQKLSNHKVKNSVLQLEAAISAFSTQKLFIFKKFN